MNNKYESDLYARFFNLEAKHIKNMSDSDLENHIEALTLIIIEARARLAACNNKLRSNKIE